LVQHHVIHNSLRHLQNSLLQLHTIGGIPHEVG
jgi:hypothetical protein